MEKKSSERIPQKNRFTSFSKDSIIRMLGGIKRS